MNSIVKELPSQQYLNDRLTYDENTGRLYRKKSGKEAFTFADKRGYLHGKIGNTNFQAHRIIWKMVRGYDPRTIDHINGDKGDNRIANLRECSIAENCQNYKKPPGSSSKYRGVCWVKRDRAWAARISCAMKKISIGNFKDEISAARAYDAAARKFHGEFAVLNFPEEAQWRA